MATLIRKQTVFVLGAGANVPYGFSTGGDLVEKVREADPRALMGSAGEAITRQESERFRVVVLDNLLPSIDALLEQIDSPIGGRRESAIPLGAPETDDTNTLGLALSVAEEAITIVREGRIAAGEIPRAPPARVFAGFGEVSYALYAAVDFAKAGGVRARVCPR